MSELSREQVEALEKEVRRWWSDPAAPSFTEAVARTVAAMLDKARAEGAAAVVRDVEAVCAAAETWTGRPFGHGILSTDEVRAVLAPHIAVQAPEGPVDGLGAQGWTTGTTRPECGTQALSGRMVCQLRRGHPGDHEDYRDVAKERRA